MINIIPVIIISSTIPHIEYTPPNKYIFDNDYSDAVKKKYETNPFQEILYKALIEEIERGQHGPIRHGE